MDLTIRIAGEAGQGLKTTGTLLVEAMARSGLHVLATQSYMSRIRGGLNWFDIRLADVELFSPRASADLLVALNETALETLRGQVSEGGVILYNGPAGEGVVGIALTEVAKELGSAVMANSVAAGAIYALLGYDVEKLCDYLKEQFARLGEQIVQQNIACARRGFELGAEHAGSLKAPSPAGAPAGVISGGQAAGQAVAEAGVKLVAAYPMTPATAVFTHLASVADEFGIVVEQAEDEIAAANMVCGAVYAGIPAITTTSGGGFALMGEAVSLAGIMELPLVIFLAQRPGPATGLPTRTAQQDLRLVLHAGHGEFSRAFFAPGTVRQAYELTRRALETAHKFQTPTFILRDQSLVDLEKNISPIERHGPIDRHILTDAGADYARYAAAEGGVSPRAIPGRDAFVVSDSDEHTAQGHITEDLRVRIAQQDKRMAKLAGLEAEAMAPELYGPADAATLAVCWGSTYGPAREAIDRLTADGESAAMLHFRQVHPLNVKAVAEAIGQPERLLCVEGNQTGQLASILREAGLIGQCELITRYDGLPFSGEELAERISR